MKKVSVKFNYSGKWAVSLERQISFEKDEVVNDLPKDFADRVVNLKKGKIVEHKETKKPVEEEICISPPPSLSTPEMLVDMGMKSLRTLGKSYRVVDNKKEHLVNKILSAQQYNQTFLDGLPDEDLATITHALEIDTSFVKNPANPTSQETDFIVGMILKAQSE